MIMTEWTLTASYISIKIGSISGCMITVRNLTKRFNGFNALDDLSFTLEDPGIFGVIGHNGAGKTTLLKILSGLIQPTSGSVIFNSIDIIKEPRKLKEKLGYLPEESQLYDNMSAEAYLTFFGEIYSLGNTTIKTRTEELFNSLNLETNGKKIGEMSKGMRRKVSIARSLLHNPDFLVYDEPTSGLDPMTSRYIIDYLKQLSREEEKTIVISAHNLYQVEEISDVVLILKNGREMAYGTMDMLREKFGTSDLEIRFKADEAHELCGLIECTEDNGIYITIAKDIESLNRITSLISEHGGVINKVESRHLSLEDMLLKIEKEE